jgi:hypothetical protein
MLATRPDCLSPAGLALAEDLSSGKTVGIAEFNGLAIEAVRGRDHLWLHVRGEHARFALRACSFIAGPGRVKRLRRRKGEGMRLLVESLAGQQEVILRCHENGVPMIELTCAITPAKALTIPFLPRDLYPLDAGGMPGGKGTVEAGQRGMNSGMCLLRLQDPGPSTLLYWQDFTALNPYFAATGTKPDGVVGGEWPELGFRLPADVGPQINYPGPLPAGRKTVLSRALVALHRGEAADESDLAMHVLTLMAEIYPHLQRPRTELRDWRGRAERTAKDLAGAPGATVQHYGHTYVRPYNCAEYPDSMTQVTLVAALREWARERGEPVKLVGELEAGIARFYDSRLNTLRRYLPNVGDDKDADEVDSWYMYYPLLGLARMALQGDDKARELLLRSVDYSIEAAQHFDYCWPIKFRLGDFSVITAERGDDGVGQTDVGGLYAYIMLLTFELTGEDRFLHEGRAALEAARGLRFQINYQANLTAWGAAAAVRLWRIIADEQWRRLSYIYVASFLHNVSAWESEIGHAKHYHNFLSATALHDAPYMALLECSESFLAFSSYLRDSGPDLLTGARLLIDEYCRYAIDRAWFYFPDTLPPEALSQDPRNGVIDPTLSFPVEDLYVDGQEAGQVGQEIYGAAAAFIFGSLPFHQIEGAEFSLFCDSFVMGWERPSSRSATLQLAGSPEGEASLVLIPEAGGKIGRVSLALADGRKRRPKSIGDTLAFAVPGDAALTLRW